jgi:hypothetical protein
MKISNLAICMYGQYRSGDVIVPHIKSIIDQIEVDKVDIFCSVKNSLSFHASDRLLSKGIQLIQEEEKQRIFNFLTDQLSPASINFLEESETIINEKSNGVEFNHHGVLSPAGVIDALLLKQKHEAANDMYYDAVILLRYDVMFRPLDYIPKLIKKISETNDLKVWPNDPDSMIAPGQNHALAGNNHARYTLFNNMINDLFIMFTGSAADRMCYEMIDYMHTLTSIYNNTDEPKYESYTNYMNFHILFGRLGSKISCHMIKTPGISQRWHTGGVMDNIEERLINDPDGPEIHMIVARPEPEIFGLDPNINEDYVKIGSFWNNA